MRTSDTHAPSVVRGEEVEPTAVFVGVDLASGETLLRMRRAWSDDSRAGCFAGEPTDDFAASPGLTEGALDGVGVSDPPPVLLRETQVSEPRAEIAFPALDRKGLASSHGLHQPMPTTPRCPSALTGARERR